MMKTAMDRTTQQREHDKALEREAELRREVEEQKHEFDQMMSKVALQMAELQALKTSFSQFSVSPHCSAVSSAQCTTNFRGDSDDYTSFSLCCTPHIATP